MSLLDAEWAVPGGASGKLVSLPGPPPRAQRVPGGGAGSGVGGGAGGAFPVAVWVAVQVAMQAAVRAGRVPRGTQWFAL